MAILRRGCGRWSVARPGGVSRHSGPDPESSVFDWTIVQRYTRIIDAGLQLALGWRRFAPTIHRRAVATDFMREMPDKRETYALKRIVSLLSGMTVKGARPLNRTRA